MSLNIDDHIHFFTIPLPFFVVGQGQGGAIPHLIESGIKLIEVITTERYPCDTFFRKLTCISNRGR